MEDISKMRVGLWVLVYFLARVRRSEQRRVKVAFCWFWWTREEIMVLGSEFAVVTFAFSSFSRSSLRFRGGAETFALVSSLLCFCWFIEVGLFVPVLVFLGRCLASAGFPLSSSMVWSYSMLLGYFSCVLVWSREEE